jgi:hypothetical protein
MVAIGRIHPNIGFEIQYLKQEQEQRAKAKEP